MTKKNDISTPQGYFDQLQQRLMDLPGREARPTVIQRVSPWLAYAASLAILVAVGNFVLRKAAAPAEEDTGWDYVAWLAQSLDPDGVIELTEPSTLSDEDILSYLLADNLSVEQLETLNYEEDY